MRRLLAHNYSEGQPKTSNYSGIKSRQDLPVSVRFGLEQTALSSACSPVGAFVTIGIHLPDSAVLRSPQMTAPAVFRKAPSDKLDLRLFVRLGLGARLDAIERTLRVGDDGLRFERSKAGAVDRNAGCVVSCEVLANLVERVRWAWLSGSRVLTWLEFICRLLVWRWSSSSKLPSAVNLSRFRSRLSNFPSNSSGPRLSAVIRIPAKCTSSLSDCVEL